MFIIGEDRHLIVPRTELTYPGHNERMHENAATAPVDHVMADLEDACPYEFKGETSRNRRVNPKVPRDKAMESSGSDCATSFLNDGKWVCWRATNRKLASFPPFAGLG